MSQSLGPYAIAWLAGGDKAEPVSPGQVPAVTRLDYAIPPDFGQAWAEQLDLGNGITLFRGVHDLATAPSRLIPLIEVESSAAEAPFGAQIWLSGSGCHHEYWHGRQNAPVEIVARPGRDTFRYYTKLNATVLIEGGVHSEMRSVVVASPMLRTLLGEAESALLLDRLGLAPHVPTVVRSVPLHVSYPLREAMSSRYAGSARRLYAQAKALEYLAGLYSFASEEGEPSRAVARHASRIHVLRDRLLALEGRLPTLNELSAEFGLSARTLNATFMAEFGQSILSFVTSHRLEQAHLALLESNVPIKQLGARLGYSHANHFNAAFRRKYGYPPGSLRRGRKEADS